MPDDYRDDTQTGGAVTVGGSATGEIESNGDRDWFAVTLDAGKTYRFDLKGSGTRAGTLRDPYLYGIYNADGTLLGGTTDNDGGGNRNSRVTFTATEDATYYVSAAAYQDGEGTYTLSVTDVTDGVPDDFTAGTGTAGVVAVGGSATGEIESDGDRDWFAVTLEAGKLYRFELEGFDTGADTLRDPYLRGIYDTDGTLIGGTTDDDGGIDNNSRVTFRATEDGTYYVSAGASGDGEGTYTLSAREIVDDLTAGTDTAGVVAIGNWATGEIQFDGDHDWFAVTMQADRVYRFDMHGWGWFDDDSDPLRYPYLRGIYDADGDRISGTAGQTTGRAPIRPLGSGDYWNSGVTFVATEDTTATYYVSVGAHRGGEGAYRLVMQEIVDDLAGIRTTATVTVGGSARGGIDFEGDRDWFAVTLEMGKTYQFDLEGPWSGRGTLSDPYLYGIHDADGNLIDGTTDSRSGIGFNSRVTFTAPEDATYYVSAGNDEGGGGTYTLSVTDVTAGVSDDFTAGIDTTGAVTVGGSATGTIETGGDYDWFAVTLVAGDIYQFDLEGSRTGAGTLWDPYLLGIYDAGGNYINRTKDDDGGIGHNSRVTFTAIENATYYVSAAALWDGEGTYTLSVTDSIPDDFTAGRGTAGAVTVGGSATGEIEIDRDRDWFAVTLVAGNYYQFDLEGSWTGAGTLYDPYLFGIYDAGGNLIEGTRNDDGGVGSNSLVTFRATEDATYYVSAGAYGYREGTYTLSVTDVTDSISDDFTAGIGTAGAVTVGNSATGTIDFEGDRDWFAITLEAGRTYRFDLERSGVGAGALSDPYLRGIYDADGRPIEGTRNDDGGVGPNSRVMFKATEDGTYYVSAGGYGYEEGAYTLSVRDVTDDFRAGTGTTGAVTVGGSATGEIESKGDRDWFAVTLEAGNTYRFDLEGVSTDKGTLSDPYIRGIYDGPGHAIAGTRNDDGGEERNSRVMFTAPGDGTYYVSASGYGEQEGTYTLSVEEVL